MEIKEILVKAHNIKYEPESVDIMFRDGKTVVMDAGFVTELLIEKNYEDDYFPIIKLSLNIKPDLYRSIIKDKESVKIRLKVKKNIYDKDNNFIKFESFFNEVFCFFLDDASPLMDKDSIESANKVEGDTTPNDFKEVHSFYLFKEKEVTACKNIVNDVLHGSLIDIAVYLVQKMGLNKILMSKPDNQSSIRNLLIPALNMVETFDYIEQKVGIYSKGLMLFFDIDCIYIIDKNYKCTAWRLNENKQTMIHIFNRSDEYNQTPGVYNDTKDKVSHIFSNTSSVKIMSGSIINNQIGGNETIVITPSENKKTSYKTKTAKRGKDNVKITVSEDNNKYFVESEQTRMKENDGIVNITFVDTDLSTLSPNKEFVIKFNDLEVNKTYGGKYRITKYLSIFKKEGSEFSSLCSCEFRKQEN